MEGSTSFTDALTAALARRRDQVAQHELPKLRELFRALHSSYQGLYSIFANKRMIIEDPYKHEQKISEVTAPADEPYLETDRDTILGVRLAEYDNLLEFLNSYYEFTLDHLDFTRLRDLTNLVRYINWAQMTTTSQGPTTRGVAELVGRARQGTDTLSTGIIGDATEQLRKNAAAIVEQLKVIGSFQREEYKLRLRTQVLPSVPNAPSLAPDSPDTLNILRRQFSQSGLPGPFIPELATEALLEEFGPDSAKLQQAVLDRLNVEESGGTKKKPMVELRQTLVDAVRALAASSRSLDASLERLRDNAEILENKQKSVMQRFKAWIDKLVNRRPKPVVYDVEYRDESTGAKHTESIALDTFLETIHKKATVYGSILARSGSVWAKIQKAEEEQLYKFLDKELGDCHLIHRRAMALDSYFKTKASRDDKKKLRGIKIELTTIRNSIVKANQLKHEYTAKKEELEQMKRLGIKTE